MSLRLERHLAKYSPYPPNWPAGQEASAVFVDTTAGSQTLLLAWGHEHGNCRRSRYSLTHSRSILGAGIPHGQAGLYSRQIRVGSGEHSAIVHALTGITPNGSKDRDADVFSSNVEYRVS